MMPPRTVPQKGDDIEQAEHQSKQHAKLQVNQGKAHGIQGAYADGDDQLANLYVEPQRSSGSRVGPRPNRLLSGMRRNEQKLHQVIVTVRTSKVVSE